MVSAYWVISGFVYIISNLLPRDFILWYILHLENVYEFLGDAMLAISIYPTMTNEKYIYRKQWQGSVWTAAFISDRTSQNIWAAAILHTVCYWCQLQDRKAHQWYYSILKALNLLTDSGHLEYGHLKHRFRTLYMEQNLFILWCNCRLDMLFHFLHMTNIFYTIVFRGRVYIK